MRAVLLREGLAPHRRLGQNFLVRADHLEAIADAAGIDPGDVVLEVGPGLGGLTERLLQRGAHVLAVEVDRGLAAALPRILGDPAELELLHADVMAGKSTIEPRVLERLRELSEAREGAAFKVVANLPYQVSSPFMAALVGETEPPWSRAVLLLQREVARVLQARPGSPDFTALSFLARLYLDVRSGSRLGPACFHPAPQVDSQVVILEPAPGARMPARRLRPVVRRLFQSRRKALLGILPAALADAGLEAPPRERLAELCGAQGIRDDARVDGVEPAALEALVRGLAGS